MALAVVPTAMAHNERQNMHPFFTKPQRSHASEPTPRIAEGTTDDPPDDPENVQPETAARNGTKRRGKRSGSVKDKASSSLGKGTQSSLDLFARRPDINDQACRPAAALPISRNQPSDDHSSAHRSKRRKTTPILPSGDERSRPHGSNNVQSHEPMDWQKQLEIEAGKGGAAVLQETACNVMELSVSHTIMPHARTDTLVSTCPTTPPPEAKDGSDPKPAAQPEVSPSHKVNEMPRKTMKVNKNGKLVSPRPTKASQTTKSEPTTPKKRRQRKPKTATSTVTVILYGIDDESRQSIGQRIEAILSRPKGSYQPTFKKTIQKSAGPPKATHPFFLGKALPNAETREPRTAPEARVLSPQGPRKSAVTPGKLKADCRSQHYIGSEQAFGPVFASSRPPKHVGLDESPWPSKETAHVRNLDTEVSFSSSAIFESASKVRKMKGTLPAVSQDEDIIFRLAHQLAATIHNKRDALASELEPPQDVRLPERLLTTGKDLQEQVRSQLGARFLPSDPSLGDLKGLHPAVHSLFCDIEHTLTPFDLAKCDTQSWAHKYAPKTTSHVLQVGGEPATLREWLTSLTVMAVGGSVEGSRNPNDAKKLPKKKRKKTEDDFVVGSDEEEDEEMIELDDRYTFSDSRRRQQGPRSIRRLRWTRNKNVVVISGPHGCGKSAMVYAVAKDLGFEVFEINSGSRRSGKDIHDKVGDMSENHLVSHNRRESSSKPDIETADDTDNERHSSALQKDLDSGRQVTMTSFFKGTGGVQPKSKSKSRPMPADVRRTPPSGQATLMHTQPKSQKQSLILFEEADILFEEDQQFWPNVSRLAAQSKRPIVVTCNDESRVPMHELPLAAVLRLSPPTTSLATDYMLALAGREGHVLDRNALSSLYELKGRDLRASIMELNLWCQMSVGDRKGGLEWMYQRWPPGQDVDKHGRTLRVASQGTYQSGMGCLSHDLFVCSNNIVFDRERELLKEAWADWDTSPRHFIETKRAYDAEPPTLARLGHLDIVSESVSAADVYCRVSLPTYERDDQQPTDPSLPPIPEKERLNYTTAGSVLQVDHASDFSRLDADIFLESQLCIRRAYGRGETEVHGSQLTIPHNEPNFVEIIIKKKQNSRNPTTLERPDFSEALDTLAYLPDGLPAMNTSYNLIASSFDRTFNIVVEDLAPYVRSIIAHEVALEAQRLRLGSLLSEGGSRVKRQRTTRAARTALEGGDRQTKRRERWFGPDLNRVLVMGTAGKEWAGMGSASAPGSEDAEGSEKASGSCSSTQSS